MCRSLRVAVAPSTEHGEGHAQQSKTLRKLLGDEVLVHPEFMRSIEGAVNCLPLLAISLISLWTNSGEVRNGGLTGQRH